ncbi:AAA family ATPase [Sphingosinithalassobacter sp. CS137]|uniref:bifunctional aminoglycoside phosphotransferase/ATP-binding protein n=1 Tax=Sphingosinithalassobacter sp. CS137 TaxID=2762748 RepID=UPI00165EA149|nr:bifunctional aminoglycoside phosphotransferase/ATP-binding protein [Sphingosinithalassobacter sp. CS137]
MAAGPAEGESRETHAKAVAFLAGGAAFGGVRPEHLETHAAHVFLTADRAWKMKRAVRFPYLDFSTPERRRAALDAELALNRRTAPALYRAVHPIVRMADGGLELGGEGEPVDWVLEMVRFPDDALLEKQAAGGWIDTATLLRLTDRIQELHARAEPSRIEGAAAIRQILDGNAESFAAVSELLDPAEVAALDAAQRTELNRHADRLDARARGGRVRRGHGDLHLRNIALIDGEPVLFDCLEFDEQLATTDILYDVAFLLMDLWHRGMAAEANIVANRYLDVAPQGASGYALLPLFVSVRAAIRAHVRAAESLRNGDSSAAEDAQGYLAFARAALLAVPPRLVAIGGLSGTGKTTIARAVGARIGRVPGARVLRSDVFRKRLAGVAPETRLPPSSYTSAAAAETYEALFESAEDHLGCGTGVILDAVFHRRHEREVAEILADRSRLPFTGIWLEAPEHERVARVSGRTGDASDAGPEIAREQSRRSTGDLSGWHRIRVNRPIDRVIAAVRAILDRPTRA